MAKQRQQQEAEKNKPASNRGDQVRRDDPSPLADGGDFDDEVEDDESDDEYDDADE